VTMRTLVHLSDLHFGRTDPAIVDPLVAAVQVIRPDCVVISGDLTQRARAAEFRQARAFLDQLPRPQIVVPGNHDVPMYRVWERLLNPFGNYRRYIDAKLETSFADEEIAVLGVNTARALTFKGGRINTEQMHSIQCRLSGLPDQVMKVVVTHHPFDLPDDPTSKELVGRARKAMEVFSSSGVDLLLAGHFHTSQAGETSARHDIPGYAALAVQAGTATSTRGRGETNSFNVLRVGHDAIDVGRHIWHPEQRAFVLASTQRFVKRIHRWAAC
jgi:3',5'-cyclic AMP phosphodiesterase CpdA